MSSRSSGSVLTATSFPKIPDEQELIPTGVLRSDELGLLFVLTQVLEFLQLDRGQNRSQFI